MVKSDQFVWKAFCGEQSSEFHESYFKNFCLSKL